MAINFLNTVNLNKNQLNNAAIQNLAADPSGAVEGQIYFNTVDHDLKIFANGAWKEVGATSGVETLSTTKAGNSTGNPLTVLSNAVGDVTINSFAYAGGSNIGYVPSGGLVNQYMDGTGAWVDVTTGDIESVNASTINNRLGISVTTPLGPDPTVGLNIVGQANLANVVSDDELIIYDKSSTTNKSITVENLVGGYETTYDLTTAPTGTAVRLTGSDSTNDDVTISGFSGQTTMTRISGTELRVALTSSVTIANSLTLTNGAFTQTAGGENNLNANLDMNTNKLLNVATGTADTDGVNWGQVRDAIAGVGLFQGGYNATTGLTVNLTTNGSLDGASNIALDKGDYFVVTTAGTAFYGVTLEVGDMIYANVDITANSNPAQSVYTVVIQDANIAGAGSTDGATQKGVAGFDSANFTVSGTGWVQLKEEVLSGRMAKVTLTGGDNSVAGETKFTVNLATLFGSGAAADDAIATVKEEASNLIVYPEVTGNGTGSLDIVFMPQVGNGDYRAVISIV
jgi:hypothetical protein